MSEQDLDEKIESSVSTTLKGIQVKDLINKEMPFITVCPQCEKEMNKTSLIFAISGEIICEECYNRLKRQETGLQDVIIAKVYTERIIRKLADILLEEYNRSGNPCEFDEEDINETYLTIKFVFNENTTKIFIKDIIKDLIDYSDKFVLYHFKKMVIVANQRNMKFHFRKSF